MANEWCLQTDTACRSCWGPISSQLLWIDTQKITMCCHKNLVHMTSDRDATISSRRVCPFWIAHIYTSHVGFVLNVLRIEHWSIHSAQFLLCVSLWISWLLSDHTNDHWTADLCHIVLFHTRPKTKPRTSSYVWSFLLGRWKPEADRELNQNSNNWK